MREERGGATRAESGDPAGVETSGEVGAARWARMRSQAAALAVNQGTKLRTSKASSLGMVSGVYLEPRESPFRSTPWLVTLRELVYTMERRFRGHSGATPVKEQANGRTTS